MNPSGKAGLFAATALSKVMSGDMTTGLTLAVGKPGYDPEKNVLYLPAIPADDVPEHVLDRLLAFLGHEAAERGRSTWMPKDPRWAQNVGLKHLVNGINDARIDLEQSRAYPGFGMKMRAVRGAQAKRLVKLYRDGKAQASFNTISILCVFLGERILTMPQLYRLFPKWRKFLRRGEPVMATLDVSTEAKCIEQALTLYALLKNDSANKTPDQNAAGTTTPADGADVGDAVHRNTPPAPPPAPPAETSGTDEALNDDSEDEAADEDETGTAAHGDTDGDDDGGLGDSGALGRGGEDTAPSAGGDAGDPELPGGDSVAARTRPGQGGTLDGDDREPLAVGDGETLQDALLDSIVQDLFPRTAEGGITSYTYNTNRDIVRTADPAATAFPPDEYARAAQVLTTIMRQVLVAPAKRPRRDRDSGELDERAVGRFVAGDEHVFRHATRQVSDSVATTVSWDESGSMRGCRIAVVRALVHAWNESLGRLGIPTELLGWSTYGVDERRAAVYRQGSVRHLTYKAFAERWNDRQVLRRLNNITTGSGTPTAEGLLYAAERIGHRPETRRVIFFLTDGLPGMSTNGQPRVHLDFIATVVRRCAHSGIELIGVGIQQDVSHLFPVSLQVDTLADMYGVATQRLIKILKSTRRQVA